MKTTMREMRRPCSSIISLSITIQQLIKKIRLFLKNNKLIAYQIIHPPTKLSRGKIDGQMRTGVNLPLHRSGPTSGELPERFFNILFFNFFTGLMSPFPISRCCLFPMFLALGFLGFQAALLLICINPGVV